MAWFVRVLDPSRRPRLPRAQLVVFLLVVLGCARGPAPAVAPLPSPIELSVSEGEFEGVIDGIRIVPAPDAAEEALAADARLRAQAETFLERRGGTTADSIRSAARLEIDRRVERVRKRSWSSDPDASGVRLVERDEAVVVLRLLRAESGAEAWRAEARTVVGNPPNDSEIDSQTFPRLLEAALERLPAAR